MPDALVRVTVVFSPAPREVLEWPLELPAGSCVADAVAASGLRAAYPDLALDALGVGVWGRMAAPKQSRTR